MKKLLLSLSMAALLPTMALADSFDVTFGGTTDGTKDWPNISAYDKNIETNVEFGGSKWNLNHFNNNNNAWKYVKAGKKDVSNDDCYLSSTSALPYKINKVTVTVDAVTTNNGTVNSATLYVADDNNFTNATTYTLTGDLTKAGSLVASIPSPAANKYYKVNFNVSATKNGLIQISKFTFDYEAEAGFVQAPTMTPAAGWVMNGTKVELAAQDGASIFYTTDGTAPTAASTAYTEAITVDKDMTIKAIAKLNEDLSEVKENAYKVYAVNSAEAPLTPTQALALIDTDFDQDIQVYVGGTISEIDNVDVTEYHNATYTIKGSDGGEIIVFRGKYLDNQGFTAEDQIGIGDKVVVYGKLINFNGTKEINSNNYIVSIERAPATKCATPTFSVESGTTLLKGDVVTISTTTEGAVIVYTIGETTTTSESNTVDVTINETCTITAKATKEGLDDSEEATATYTVKQLGEREYEYTFDFTGEEAYGMTLRSSTFESGKYNEDPTVCTGENITLTLNGQTRWWKATKTNELRFHTNSSFTIAGKAEGTLIKEIELIGATKGKWGVEAETRAAVNGYEDFTWTGNQNSVTFKTNITEKNTAITGIRVLYQVPSAVETIEAETEAPARYFNLQGVEVANPANGLYIRVQGKKATKVIL